jgi:TonB family protein
MNNARKLCRSGSKGQLCGGPGVVAAMLITRRGRRFVLVLAILLTISRTVPVLAEAPIYLKVQQAIPFLARVAKPEYPYEARRERVTGSGLFELKFDYETGKLREIHCLKSTGNGMLDVASIRALKIWLAKPRTLKTIRVPITFVRW